MKESDITEKIRSAIKAKLGQIGAYVDDELPDYIMVMIANKKTIEQITEDLSLFLGKKTERFTDWLDKLLKKLNAVDGEGEGKEEEKRKKEADKPKKVKSEKKSSKKDDRSSDTKKRETRKRRSDEISNSSKVDEKTKPESKPSEEPSTSNDVVEDAIVVSQDTTEFEEVVKKKKVESPSKKGESRSVSDRKLIKTSTGENVPIRKVRQELLRERRQKNDERRKRREVTSVVASVNLKGSESESEEEEFRSNSTVSVVRNKRRPAGPYGRGEEKLLVRACREATSSVHERRYDDRGPRQDDWDARRYEDRGYQRHDERDKRPYQERPPRSRHDPPPMIREPHAKRTESETRQRREHLKPLSRCVATGTQTSPVPKTTEEKAEKNPSKDSKASQVTETDKPVRSIYDYDEKRASEYAQPRLAPKRLSDEFAVVAAVADETSSPTKSVQRDLPMSDSDASVEEVTDSRKVQCRDRERTYSNDRSSPEDHSDPHDQSDHDPKFIVTLDGGPPTRTITGSEMDESEYLASSDMPLTSTPLDSKRSSWDLDEVGPRVVANDLNDKIGKSLDELIPEKPKNARCKFWPACRFGTECQFVHPSQPCHMFPKCSFGNRCLYIHPNCRFDAACVNVDCPYMHASRRDPLTLAAAKIIKMVPHQKAPVQNTTGKVCRFYPNCMNQSCPFVHPKECRYGASCKNMSNGCPFSHPPMPTPDRFKWCNNDKFVIS